MRQAIRSIHSQLVARRLLGRAAILLGAVLFAAMAISVKYATEAASPGASKMPAAEVVFFRFSFGLIALQLLSWAGLIQISHKRFPLKLARGAFGGLAIWLYFYSIQATTLTKATLLGNSYPIFTAVFGTVILKERLTLSTLFAFCAAALGVWLVIDPGTLGVWSKGDIVGVLTAMVSAIALIIIRELRKTDNPFTIFWYLSAVGTALGLLGSLGSFVTPNPMQWIWLVTMGACSMCGQLLITYGLRFTTAAEGSLIAMSTVAYSGLFGWLMMGDSLSLHGLAGAVILLAATVYLTLRPSAAEV